MKSLALFNNKGGVGKTTLTFHIAHMLARKGHRVVVLDYDPQCGISTLFLQDEDLVEIWQEDSKSDRGSTKKARTVAGCIELVRHGAGAVREPELVRVTEDLWLLPGHLELSRFEQELAYEWPNIALDSKRALDVTLALDSLSNMAAEQVGADIVLIDVSPSIGALNRAACLACDAVVVPLAPDVFSLQGLENVGATLREWRHDWEHVSKYRLRDRGQGSLSIHRFQPIGYIVQQHLARVDRRPSGYLGWASRIPWYFHRHVLDEPDPPQDLSIDRDEQCIAWLKHIASLVPVAQIARKPIFDLEQADGIGGGQLPAVARCRREFESLVDRLLDKLGKIPEATTASAS